MNSLPATTLLPPFDENGVLPHYIYAVDEKKFRQWFVDGFPSSQTRRPIYDGFCNLRADLSHLKVSGWHWLDGSYVTTKENPEDLDIVTFGRSEDLEALPKIQQVQILGLVGARDRTKVKYRCHTFWVTVYDPDDPEYALYQTLAQDWALLWGKTNLVKVGYEIPKGFVQLVFQWGNTGILESTEMTDSLVKPDAESSARDDIEWTVETMSEHLTRRTEIRQYLEKSGINRFSTRLQIESLKNEEAWLQRKIAAVHFLQSEVDAELVIDGKPVNDHRVDAGFLGNLLSLVQNVVDCLTYGKLPHRLEVASFSPSSFRTAFTLTPLPEPEPQLQTIPMDLQLESVAESNLPAQLGADALTKILDAATSNTDIINTLTEKPAQRYYAQLVKLIGRSGATVYFRTRQNPIGAMIGPVQASERAKWLTEVDIKISSLEIEGELRGGSMDRRYFEIIDNGGQRYSGRAKKGVSFSGYRLGQRVRASIKQTTRTHIDLDTPFVTYMLTDIEHADDPRLFSPR